MIDQDFQSTDEALEYAARIIEGATLSDYRGIAAKRKRDREDANLRFETAQAVRKECAEFIRAMIGRPDLSPVSILRDLSELKPAHDHALHLRNAWPLAWKGWVEIRCSVSCSDNCTPPSTRWSIEITDKGRRVLASEQNAAPPSREEA